MARYVASFAVIAALALGLSATADEPKLDGVKCVVAAKNAAKADNAVEYRGAQVFFCCMNCPKAFAKDTAKFAPRANMQLVATGQAKQQKCPFTGRDLNTDTKIDVSGVAVCFCCENCQGKAEKAEGPAQVNLIFSDAAFDKGFKVQAAK